MQAIGSFNPQSGQHMLTLNRDERDLLTAEGAACRVYPTAAMACGTASALTTWSARQSLPSPLTTRKRKPDHLLLCPAGRLSPRHTAAPR